MPEPAIPSHPVGAVAGPYVLRRYAFRIIMDNGPWIQLVRRFFRHLECIPRIPAAAATYEIRRVHDLGDTPGTDDVSDILLIAPAGQGKPPLRISLAGRSGFMRLGAEFFQNDTGYLGAILEFLRDHVAAQEVSDDPLPPLFHAAAFAAGPRTLWMPGLSEAGKTTQTLALLLTRPHVQVLADDVVFVNLEQRAIEPYLLPLRLLPETALLLARHGLSVPDSWRAEQFCCPPPERVWDQHARAPSILVALGRGDAVTSVRSLRETEALHLLLPRGDILRFPHGVRTLQEMIGACTIRVELRVGQVPDGAAVLGALLDGADVADLPPLHPGHIEVDG